MLDVIDRRGDPAFIADRGGLYTERYFDHGQDVILNPLDSRSVGWSPLAEMRNEFDAESISRSIVPPRPGQNAEFAEFAANFLSGVLVYCWREGLKNRDVLRLVQSAAPDELRSVLAGHPAVGLLGEGAERLFGTVRGDASTACSSLARLHPDAGADAFSIRRWVTGQGRGRLFFPYQADQLRALRSLVSTMADVFAESVLSLPPSFSRRIWLVLDEFASLGKVDQMENFLTNSRKNGGCAVLGMQSIAQVRDLYGREASQSMLSSISTSLYLRQPDPETADWVSRALGDRQIIRTMKSGGASDSYHGSTNSQNWSQQVSIERAVLPAELLRLADGVGFLTLAGNYPHARVSLSLPEKREPRAESFIPAPLRPSRLLDVPDAPASRASRPTLGGPVSAATPPAPAAPPEFDL